MLWAEAALSTLTYLAGLRHRRNILAKWHKKVNIGLAWDQYNFKAIQHFEGDYLEYERMPEIDDGLLSVSGRTKNGARFDRRDFSRLFIHFDPPPHALTRGQLARNYCYDPGLLSVIVRPPSTIGRHYLEDQVSATHNPCPSPYSVPSVAPAPASPEEANALWQQAYDASQSRTGITVWVPAVTASEWEVSEDKFSVTADLSEMLEAHGDGVYTVTVFEDLGGEGEAISEYSIFHGVEPPDTYNPTRQ